MGRQAKPRGGTPIGDRPRVVLAHDTTPGDGGQGAHLGSVVEALEPGYALSGFARNARGTASLSEVPRSRLAGALEAVPWARRLRDWQVMLESRSFDRRVARKLEAADVYHGVAGQARRSLVRAGRLGAARVLDVLNPHVDHFGEMDDEECAKFGMRPLLHPRHRDDIRREYDLADVLRVESQFSRETFLDRGFRPDEVVRIPPVVDPEAFAVRREPAARFRVVFVGLFQPWKGFHYLVEAFEKASIPDSELVLWGGIGSRSVRRYLHERSARNPSIRLASGNLRELGYEPAFGRASVLVHPSLAEGWGYVVSEAMACGVPVIVTTWTGAAETVEDGQSGYVVPPRDADAIAERLVHLSNNPRSLEELGEGARRSARQLSSSRFRDRYTALVDAARGARREASARS
jgi:glycosyltransferase involved in cell wall biosynthesis